MDNTYVLGSNGELYHWGIKGMKWGVRRFQNKDGSLTPAGRKRYDDPEDDRVEPAKRKSAKDMTDEELGRAIARARAEDEYNRLRPEKSPEPAKKPSFAKKFMEDAVKPALINSGRKAMESAMDKVVKDLLKDKVDPESIDALTKMRDKLKLKNEIRILKDGKKDSDKTIDELTKEYELERKKRTDAENDANAAVKKEREDYEYERKKIKDAQSDYEFERKKKQHAEDDAAAEAKAKASADETSAQERRQRQINRNIMTRAANNISSRTKNGPSQDEFDFDFKASVDSGKTFFDSHGDFSFSIPEGSKVRGNSFVDSGGKTLFDIPESTRNNGRDFVDSYGDILFSWTGDD